VSASAINYSRRLKLGSPPLDHSFIGPARQKCNTQHSRIFSKDEEKTLKESDVSFLFNIPYSKRQESNKCSAQPSKKKKKKKKRTTFIIDLRFCLALSKHRRRFDRKLCLRFLLDPFSFYFNFTCSNSIFSLLFMGN
jgi:hypothetical protein